MNSLRFIQMMATRFANREVAKWPADDKLALVRAINLSLKEWFDLVPSPARIRPITATFFAPRTVNVTVTNGSATIAFATDPESTAIGSTIVFSGDAAHNRLLSLTRLQSPYQGTTGTVSATLYGNAYALPSVFETLGSALMLLMDNGERRQLLPPSGPIEPLIWQMPPYAGLPTHYALEPGQTLDGVAPYTVLRLYPSPASAARVVFDYSGLPFSWTMTDIQVARELDLRDRDWNELTALVQVKLINDGLLAERIDMRALYDEADRARTSLRNSPIPGTGAPASVGTPPGF